MYRSETRRLESQLRVEDLVVLTYFALLEDVSRHDPHLAPLTDDTRAVPANHPALALAFQRVHDPDLVPLRNTLGDGDDELDLVLNGLDDGVRCTGWRDVNDRSVGLRFSDSLFDGAEDGQTQVGSACFL